MRFIINNVGERKMRFKCYTVKVRKQPALLLYFVIGSAKLKINRYGKTNYRQKNKI